MACAGLFLWAILALHGASVHAASSSGNPFVGKEFYINPKNAKEFDASIATASGKTRSNLERMREVPSAYWIDVGEKIRGDSTGSVEGILKDASSKVPPELVVLMWYDLPNRDCDAKASNGQICCKKNPDGTCDYLAPGDCAEGIQEYKSTYVDPFVSVLSEYDGKVPIVLVMEPDGLANLATNIAHPHCGNMATQTAYKQGVKYAVTQLASHAPSVSIYLDAAHGGWLGWTNNLEKFMTMLKGLDLPWDHVRGFATNVANYQALGIQCPWCPDQGIRNGYCLNGKHADDPCCADPCALLSQWNFGNNEMNFAAGLVAAANSMLGMDAHVIIDTGRNGVTDQRQDCANWCNPRGAGAGVPSTTKTANTSLVDAYFWLKTPGECDGCSETLPSGKKCPRFDAKCASVDSLGAKTGEPHAPEAGHWYDYQVKQLAANAHFDLPAGARRSNSTCPASAGMPLAPAPAPLVPPVQGQGISSSSSGTSSGLSGVTQASTSGGSCAAAFQQCGGQGWAGPTCCQSGCSCSGGGGGYYKQCTPQGGNYQCAGSGSTAQVVSASTSTRPPYVSSPGSTGGLRPAQPAMYVPSAGASVSTSLAMATSYVAPVYSPVTKAPAPSPVLMPTPSPAPVYSPVTTAPVPSPVLLPTPSPAPAAAASAQCSFAYGQCGGKDWKGPTCCDQYCTCQVHSESYSECVPHSGDATGSGTLAVVLKDAVDGGFRGAPEGPTRTAIASMAALWGALPATLVLAALLVARSARARLGQRRPAPGSGMAWALYNWLPDHSNLPPAAVVTEEDAA
mmetsp:Transcript_90336/g.255777  ORF Transcript_90336/g.255777 Transcript_90336/m.255777 type:complete len:793 (-) Transcript_90336:96-2474(-)